MIIEHARFNSPPFCLLTECMTSFDVILTLDIVLKVLFLLALLKDFCFGIRRINNLVLLSQVIVVYYCNIAKAKQGQQFTYIHAQRIP